MKVSLRTHHNDTEYININTKEPYSNIVNVVNYNDYEVKINRFKKSLKIP
jgi:hypothetical protein